MKHCGDLLSSHPPSRPFVEHHLHRHRRSPTPPSLPPHSPVSHPLSPAHVPVPVQPASHAPVPFLSLPFLYPARPVWKPRDSRYSIEARICVVQVGTLEEVELLFLREEGGGCWSGLAFTPFSKRGRESRGVEVGKRWTDRCLSAC
jgi:hypothetical protein